MSQKKTVVPGLGQDVDYNPNNQFSGGNQEYIRPMGMGRPKGTVYPGMNQIQGVSNENQRNLAPARPKPQVTGKPVVGFLYSISRTGVGEYWPLHIGQNIIGNASDCDIILGEGTVSQRHANLHINKMKKPEKIEATIIDLGSTNGTQVNENSVSVARPIECQNGDIVTIGENYDLLLLLVDTKAVGLHQSETFYDVREENPGQSFSEYGDVEQSDSQRSTAVNFPPRFNGPDSPYTPGDYSSNSTVGLDSSGSGFNSGGTVGME